jgi:hypothetical protein
MGEATAPKGDRNVSERARGEEICESEIDRSPNVSAGTLNPHLPKRTIASAHILEWLQEPEEDDLA